jgi:hypothetical protein
MAFLLTAKFGAGAAKIDYTSVSFVFFSFRSGKPATFPAPRQGNRNAAQLGHRPFAAIHRQFGALLLLHDAHTLMTPFAQVATLLLAAYVPGEQNRCTAR